MQETSASTHCKEVPASQRCNEILEKREHVLIGISPFNSYYSLENIQKLIKWGSESFKSCQVFVPDTLPVFNFIAIGYAESKALSKTKHQIKYLMNKIEKAFTNLKVSVENKIITVSSCSKITAFKELYHICMNRYDVDEEFKKDCTEAASGVLRGYTKNVTQDMLDTSAKYLLGELPFYLDTPKIVGVNTSTFVYHENVDFFTNLYKDRIKNHVSENQGHTIYGEKNE
jgi:cyclo(L-tyrosyl-L-tyrosyl) synthase